MEAAACEKPATGYTYTRRQSEKTALYEVLQQHLLTFEQEWPDPDGKGQMFHPALAPTQQDVEQVVERASKRILRFLERRGVITLVTAPGDGEVTVVSDETMGEKDPLLARLLAAATAGASPAGPAHKRAPVRIVLDPDAHPVAKGKLCGQHAGFNLQAATAVAANDKKGRENLCKYILRPPWPTTG
jgi:hypothetical protein